LWSSSRPFNSKAQEKRESDMSDTKNKLQTGDQAPDFTAQGNGGTDISLSDHKGKTTILYFYPKDNTPGCTAQACAFRDILSDLQDINAHVIGVSKDSVKKHDNFIAKYDLNFPLISDEDGTLCDAYGVWKEKSMYGKTFMGIERTTFVIDENGIIRNIWRKVKVKSHITEITEFLSNMKKAA